MLAQFLKQKELSFEREKVLKEIITFILFEIGYLLSWKGHAICKLYKTIEKKGMTFDHDFCYYFPLFSSLLEKEGGRKGEWIAKIVIKSDAFLLDHKTINRQLTEYFQFQLFFWETNIFYSQKGGSFCL